MIRFSRCLAVALLPALGSAMEIQWTRMAGQWPVEASPLVVKDGDTGQEQIVILNRGGQLLLWDGDGNQSAMAGFAAHG